MVMLIIERDLYMDTTCIPTYVHIIYMYNICVYTTVSWASTHSRVSAHVTVLAVRMESTQRPGNVSQDRSDDEADENTYEDDGDTDDLDLFSDSDK